ncbi:MAG: hypothetical protein ACKOHG_19690, partial [Planctomycetia bacterium]
GTGCMPGMPDGGPVDGAGDDSSGGDVTDATICPITGRSGFTQPETPVPPMYARFRTRAYPPEAAFTFWMVDTHTDPDEVPQEVDALADVFEVMQRARPDEDDVILLGDLNAAPNQLGRIARIPNIGWAVSGTTTNTRRTKTYDNIIFARAATAEYTGRWGVLDLQSTFGLSLDQALQVSDHNPVWAAFSPWEARRTQ